MVGGEEAFQAYLGRRGLKKTRQRDAIVREFVKARRHITAEDLHRTVARRHPAIGLVTVYRTLRLLEGAGLAKERRFGKTESCYEPVLGVGHHDHLICTACGGIFEFENVEIEGLQDRVASQHGFLIQDHKLEMYGICRECRKRGERRRR
ncbi:MAG: hypothetical protein A2V83_09250 [Nitrospirae bacterium RBG_16_64_22]|nr:MAG: hypothetical protein A2V83_09250 [Nitrospirae bacterium RBG_16_64_22]